ncbi:helix-turn-helix domain-containing protein [Streptomyces sp. I6]|uniref:PucR family transcriptional regulator n=1 Tax=Streptomyces sp. I6 TaxID=2483113 RepID=UPI00160AB38F|nr:helix-turn-helix domain-containing protein [Streptomyces sp. I6]
MGSLFAHLARQVPANARREVETYTREIPEFRFLDNDPRARARTLEHAVWLRRRTVELSPHNRELSEDDLGRIASMGELRAGAGMSLDARQKVLHLHTALMLREITEATEAERGGGVDELVRMMAWFAPQSERGIGAYRQGFLRALRRRLPYTEQVALLTRSLLNGEPISTELAAAVGVELPERCAVTVFRLPDRPTAGHFLDNEIGSLVRSHRVPVMWGPEDGDGGGELIALFPVFSGAAAAENTPPHPAPGLPSDPTADHLPDLVQHFARALGRPCAVGTATAPLPELSGALDRARRISRAAPLHRAPSRLRPHTLADVFVELAVADVPFVDDWIRTVARRLETGPDLLGTLDAYYRHDMHRGATASALNVHTRTLDYRLRRVRELTGIDPGSTRGVRTLSAVVTRRVSGAWH